MIKQSIAIISALVVVSCWSAPQMNRVEPLPFHSEYGINPYPPSSESRRKGSWIASFHLTPYYQEAPGARDGAGEKVDLGTEYGNWNLAGIFYGIPRGTESGGTYTYADTTLPDSTWAESATLAELSYYPNFKRALEAIDSKYTDVDDANFDATNTTLGFDSVIPEYKRLGARAELRLAPFDGFDVVLGAGACEYRMSPKTLQPAATTDDTLINELQNENNRRLVLRDVGLTLEPIRDVMLEDTYLRISGGYPVTFRDNDNRDIAVFCPSVSAGLWIPTGKKIDHDKPFSIASGNDGHTGYFLEAASTIDFVETITISVGGGVTYFNDKTYDKFRIPSHRFQNGFYPWTSKVTRDPGYSWFGHISMRALNFIYKTSCYVDYSYQAHEADTLTCNDVDTNRVTAFAEGLKMLEERSIWNSWELHCGISHEVTPNLEISGGFHYNSDGILCFRSNTLFGCMRFIF